MALAPPPLTVSDTFKTSISSSATYPENLVKRFTYSATLRDYGTRLQRATKLFVSEEQQTEVAFRDWDEHNSNFQRQKVRSLEQIRQHLGIRHGPAPAPVVGAQVGQNIVFQKKDPKCRFVFLYGIHSRANLKITRDMFVELLSYHQIMPNYLDFVFLFGQKSVPNDIRFSGFREQTCLQPPASPNGQANLDRSGRMYELSYNLKTVQLKDPNDQTSWSVRQAGVYHGFDVVHGTTLWAITRALSDGKHDLKERIEEVTGYQGRPEDRNFTSPADSFRSSLVIHSLIIVWAAESWRWYLQWLDEIIEQKAQPLVDGTRDRSNKARHWYTGEDLQHIQKLEDSVNQVNIAVDGNIEVMTALSAHYERLILNGYWPFPGSSAEAVHLFSIQVKNAIYDLKMQSSRARALARHTSERKNLILQYMQAQTAEKMEDLTKSTYNVGILAQKEAIVMRIITVVALVYLPATFVSSFFSTDVVKYQNGGNQMASVASQTNFSALAMNRWLQVSLPLTFVTLLLAYLSYIWAKARQHRKNLEVLDSFGLV